jgi:hypothetical protein
LHALLHVGDALGGERVAAQVGPVAVVVTREAACSFSNMLTKPWGAKPAWLMTA